MRIQSGGDDSFVSDQVEGTSGVDEPNKTMRPSGKHARDTFLRDALTVKQLRVEISVPASG